MTTVSYIRRRGRYFKILSETSLHQIKEILSHMTEDSSYRFPILHSVPPLMAGGPCDCGSVEQVEDGGNIVCVECLSKKEIL